MTFDIKRYLKGLLDHKPDPIDPRDRLFAPPRAAALPPSATVADIRVSIRDQGNTSSCVGQSIAVAVQLAYLKIGISCPDLSALFTYRAARNIDGTAGDEGTYLRSGMRATKLVGAAREVDWPFDDARVNAPLDLVAARSAFDLRGIRAYYRIPSGDTFAIRQAISEGYPVVGGTQVGDAFMQWDGLRPIQAVTDRIIGGHALCLHSYWDDGTFGGPNSWSSNWGRAGQWWATEGFVAQWDDVWAVDVEP